LWADLFLAWQKEETGRGDGPPAFLRDDTGKIQEEMNEWLRILAHMYLVAVLKYE
jgi:hypothetical protein